MKIKNLIDLKKTMDKEQMVISCVKIFGSARANEILKKIYTGKELKDALNLLEKLDLMQDVTKEVLDVTEVQIDEEEDNIMKKQTKVVTKVEELDLHIDNDGIDALPDTRVVNSDHGISNLDNTLEYWLQNAKDDEELEPVSFKEVYTHLDDGEYPGIVQSVARFYSDAKTFGNKVIPAGFRFVINVALQPAYSKAEHRGYIFKVVPVFMTFSSFKSFCDQNGWEFGNKESMIGNQVNMVIDYDEIKKSKIYFLIGK